MIYHMDDWAPLMKAWHEGKRVEISRKVYWYFLEVLPPVCMGRRLTVKSGDVVRADFGFAEGEELVTAFWTHGDRFFLEQTNQINRVT